jgi:hypothetical protein
MEIESDAFFAKQGRYATDEALFIAADQFGHFAGLDDQCLVGFKECGVHGKTSRCAEPVTLRSDKKNQSETVSPACIAPVWPILPPPKTAENMDDAGALVV